MKYLIGRRGGNTSFIQHGMLGMILAVAMLLSLVNPVNVQGRTNDSKRSGRSESSKTDKASDIVAPEPTYELYVNRANNFVKVVRLNAKGEEICSRVMKCSVGRTGHSTPLGTFKTTDYYEWRQMVDGTYAQYAIRFNNHIMFHSVPYHKPSPDTLEWEEYNKLGYPASLGCIRLTVEDVKWIYDNCKRGTKVVVYDDPEDWAQTPETPKIKESSANRDWDPTDPDINNPWND